MRFLVHVSVRHDGSGPRSVEKSVQRYDVFYNPVVVAVREEEL